MDDYKNTRIPTEQYTLILRHEYIDADGRRCEIEQPIQCKVMLCSINDMRVYTKNEIIHRLWEEMLRYINVVER